MTELMNGGVIFKRAIHYPDRMESFGTLRLKGHQVRPSSPETNAAYLSPKSRFFSF